MTYRNFINMINLQIAFVRGLFLKKLSLLQTLLQKKSKKLVLNSKIKMEGIKFLTFLPAEVVSTCFFDPQYRGILDKMKYGNEGKKRGRLRATLKQMSPLLIKKFIKEIDRVLVGSGHLFLWLDKFELCSGFNSWIEGSSLEKVDLITWNKEKMGMGYRTRRQSEYLLVLQKKPKRVKGIWTIHNIPDVWSEIIVKKTHTHAKPIGLQTELIKAVTKEKGLVIDPAAGSFSVFEACKKAKRNFLGCDLN